MIMVDLPIPAWWDALAVIPVLVAAIVVDLVLFVLLLVVDAWKG